MDLATLVSLSCLVSVLTVGVLLLRRRRPTQESIPSWFLGATRQSAHTRIRLSTPPWVLLAGVLAFTAAGALLFWPPREDQARSAGKEDALVWLDPTLSAVLSRKQNNFDARAMAARLVAEGHPLHALTVRQESGPTPFAFRYFVVPLVGLAEVEAYLTEAARLVVPFARPLSDGAVLEAIEASREFKQGAGTLMVVSDGQSETLQSLTFLSDSFGAGKLFSTGTPGQFEGERAELVPSTLLDAWKEPRPAGAGDFALLDAAATSIPLQARPGLALESFGTLRFVSGVREDDKTRPLLTACGDGVGGPQELDPFSDLRAFAQFFSLPVRREACVEFDVESTEQAAAGPWDFRRQSLWIVPLSEEVAGTLVGKGQFWVPRGYEACCDSLVYAAPLRPSDAPGLPQVRQAVQLEDASLPAPLILAPPPPQEAIAFPSEAARGAAGGTTDTFVPVTEAADGTPLAYKARRARVSYVRTSLSLPNGELGRSSLWSQIWLGILADAEGSQGPRVTFIQPSSPSDLVSLPNEAFARKLDAATLEFRPGSTGAGSDLLLPGLYDSGAKPTDSLTPNLTPNWTLVGVSPFERVENLMSEADFEALWSRQGPVAGKAESEGGNASADGDGLARTPRHVALGLALAGLALSALWILPWMFRRSSAARRAGLFLSLFLCIFGANVAPGMAPGAYAQKSLRNFFFGGPSIEQTTLGAPTNIPMRIAWCDQTIPAGVAERYRTLRDLLASRGTIELPKDLLAGGCRPGAAEIWWAGDAQSLPAKALLEHVTLGGGFVLEGNAGDTVPQTLLGLETPSIGMKWERQQRRGLLYRSFYLLATFDGCEPESTWMLSLRKRAGAHSPIGLATRARFLTEGPDCRQGSEDDLNARSFINLVYALLTTDYKEDQLQLPEILSRVRNMGLEP